MWLLLFASGVCPSAPASCGACPARLERAYKAEGALIVGNMNMRCTLSGMQTLAAAGCVNCETRVEFDFPFDYSTCSASDENCEIWTWLKCANPNDGGMHSYFFIDGEFIGTGFQVTELGASSVKQKLVAAKVSVSDDPCAEAYPDAHNVVQAELNIAEANGIVLFGWDGCPCTAIAQSRFRSKDVCYQQLTWSNPSADVMAYLQCVENDKSHHSFIYTKENGNWVFRGNGFQFDAKAMSDAVFTDYLTKASYTSGCQDEFAVNLYGEPLSECRASQSDSSGSWMWDGKCTEEGGGVHQICMEKLPADFSTMTGQSAWSEGRAGMRHCVCVGAWSLYMTRENDPQYATMEASPFCSGIPASALTSRYISKWKDWNGIPAAIELGVRRLVEKCYAVKAGPGSDVPSTKERCVLLSAFRDLQALEPMLQDIVEEEIAPGSSGLDCEAAAETDASTSTSSASGSSTPTSSLQASGGGLRGEEKTDNAAAALLLALTAI